MKYYSLLLVLNFFIANSHCYVHHKLETINKELNNVDVTFIKKNFTDVESSPIILHKNGKEIATIRIVFENPLFRLAIHCEGLSQPVSQYPKGHTHFGEYDAIIIGKRAVLVSLRTTASEENRNISHPGDIWEMFILNVETYFFKRMEVKASDFNTSIESLKFTPYDDYTFELQIKTFDNKLQFRRYTNSFDLLNEFQLTLEPGSLMYDKNTKNYYKIQNLDNDHTLFEPLEWFPWGRFQFTIQHTEKIITSSKAIAADYNHVTFCFTYDKENKLECQMCKICTRKMFFNKKVEVYNKPTEIFVKNLDADNTLIIWIESSSDGWFDVWANVFGTDIRFDKILLTSTKLHIDYILYDVTDTLHCLKIGMYNKTNLIATVKQRCFDL